MVDTQHSVTGPASLKEKSPEMVGPIKFVVQIFFFQSMIPSKYLFIDICFGMKTNIIVNSNPKFLYRLLCMDHLILYCKFSGGML